MMRMVVGRSLFAVAALLWLAACADNGNSGTRPQGLRSQVCSPGEALDCYCLDGTPSTQTCDLTGTSYGQCACAAMPTPPGAGEPDGSGASGAGPGPAAGGSESPASGFDEGTSASPPGSTPPMQDPAIDPMGAAGSPATEDPMAPAGDPTSMPTGDEGVPADCTDAADWDPMWAQFEEEVLLLTNEARAAGASCGEYGSFEPAGPLSMEASLRCAARLHSQDMGIAGYFAHDSQDGRSPFDRMAEAGYSGGTMGENIAKGQQSPDEVVDGWMNSPGHCANIMNDRFTDIGVGYWEGEASNQWFNGNKLWTQNFGAPRRSRW